jgi:hypothetical protein
VYKLKGSTFVSILQLGIQRGVSIWGHAQYSKKITDGGEELGWTGNVQ